MRIFISIFFLLLLVSVQTPLGQLYKVPLLIEHFNKHKKQDGVSLIGFLQDHYATDHDDADRPEDEQLPFKNISFFAMGYAIVPVLIKPHSPVCLPADKKIIFPDTYAPQQHLASIFHPPRV